MTFLGSKLVLSETGKLGSWGRAYMLVPLVATRGPQRETNAHLMASGGKHY